MTTLKEVIEDTRLQLLTTQADIINVLKTTITDSANETPQVRFVPKGISEGVILGIDFEEMHTVSKSTELADSLITVLRGMNGSTAAAHSGGAIIRVNPFASDFRIFRAINKALNDLSALGLFRVRTAEVISTPIDTGYDLAVTDYMGPIGVSYRDVIGNWHRLHVNDWGVDITADTDDYPTGVALIVKDRGDIGQPMRLSYKSTFSPVTADYTANILTVTGLHTEAHDILSLWAAVSLMTGMDVKRTMLSSQPDSRRSSEVPPGSATSAMRPILMLLDERIKHEKQRLQRKYRGT